MLRHVALLGLAVVIAGCQTNTHRHPVIDPIAAGVDYHSFANTDEVRIEHLDLDLTISFAERRLIGSARLQLDRQQVGVSRLVLDTRDLEVGNVLDADGDPVDYEWGQTDANLGTPLIIDIEDSPAITIHYRSRPEASGLQWLTARQTTSGKPFVFSQAQAIHARSFIPLQDTPQVRQTFNATIRAPAGIRPVMSAQMLGQGSDGGWQFEMPQAIPSYLIALGAGELEFVAMSEQTGVYAEPAMVAAAAAEFDDTQAMLDATEAMFGPYRWGRYDLLILPPSFPFGGMENPRLSFITPTVIAGDKSLVALVAHELAHSWSGNLVTNAAWRDLWLNEGFTVYVEGRIMEAVYGERRNRMEQVLGFQSLQADLRTLAPRDQVLAIDLRGRDPDAVFSSVPYEKGALFLRFLEDRYGRTTFDAFLRDYFDTFAFQSITTEQFIAYLQTELIAKHPDKVTMAEVKRWIFEPGVPDVAVLATSTAFDDIDTLRIAWLDDQIEANEIDVRDWTTQEWLHFLDNLPDRLTPSQLAELDDSFALTQVTNTEIAHSWLKHAITNNYRAAYERLHRYLHEIGRRKLIVPLYEALLAGSAVQKSFAQQVYAQARPGYHNLAQGTIDEAFAKANVEVIKRG